MATGEILQSNFLLQFVEEAVPGEYNASGARQVLTCIKGEIQPEEAWDSFRPDGFSVDAWAQLQREHVIYSGQIKWDYAQAAFIHRLALGSLTATNPAPTGAVEETGSLIPNGGRDIPTYTLEYGVPTVCARFTYGFVIDLSHSIDRDGGGAEGQITILARRASETAVPMTGTVAQNEVQRVVHNAPVVLTNSAVTRTLTPGDPLTGANSISSKYAELFGLAAGAVVATGTSTAMVAGNPATVTFSGAGTATMNMTYTYVPANNRFEGNANGSLFVILFNSAEARWEAQNGSGAIFYYAPGDSSGVPTAGWTRGTIGNGTAPVPTVAYTPAVASTNAVLNVTLTFSGTGATNTNYPLPSTSTNGATVETTQHGSAGGAITLPKRVPVASNQFAVRVADSRANLANATIGGKVKKAGWNLSNLAEPVFYAMEGPTTFQSHADSDERQLQFTFTCAVSSPLHTTLDGYAKENPSRPFWFELRETGLDTKNRLQYQALVSVAEARKIEVAGKVRAVAYTLNLVLGDTPFDASGASFYAVSKRAA